MRYKQKILVICRSGDVQEVVRTKNDSVRALEKEYLGEYSIQTFLDSQASENDSVIPGTIVRVIHNRNSTQSLPYFLVEIPTEVQVKGANGKMAKTTENFLELVSINLIGKSIRRFDLGKLHLNETTIIILNQTDIKF
eukprot:CAMPEP_0170566232 /NCGR_PEP_ID=MMETSP0211-20121228/79700_1 /TAXON_ID=311385 /ORGANISM="Pseudokeronopsis sp., Strain OXSARD2" /LENGTH=137 /DNA_ID=CAMNT_0010887337 /DNA_START=211 /DNA_END=624 /DNA_ORIENTATION=-